MSTARSRQILLMLCGLASMAAFGCSDWDMPSWVPFQGPAADVVPGVVSPHDRIETLRKLSDSANGMTPNQRVRISEELAVTIKQEKDPLIRQEIIKTLDKYPSEAGDVILEAALKDPENFVRISACNALGHRGQNPKVVPLLSESLRSDADFDVRLAAAKALGETKNPAAQAALGEALSDPDPALQYQAIVALQEATGKDFGNNVERGQAYVKGETPKDSSSLASRLFKWF